LALEWMRVPYRYAFSLSLAFQSLSLLDEEWRTIRETQQARGAWQPPSGWRKLRQNISDMIALSVPAIGLVTKRAWAMTEAAYARGFDAPHRRPCRELSLKPFDWALLIGATLIGVGLMAWRLVSICPWRRLYVPANAHLTRPAGHRRPGRRSAWRRPDPPQPAGRGP